MSAPPSKRKSQQKKNWTDSETQFMLNSLKELNIGEHLDCRKARNAELLLVVHNEMEDAGYCRSVEQIRNRWKVLRIAYNKAKCHNSTSGSDPASCPYYDLLDEILGHRPMSNVEEYGVDIGLAEAPEEDSIAGRLNNVI